MWLGSHTRFFCRDLPADRIFGCDSCQDAIDICREHNIAGKFFLSGTDGTALPFDQRFDLIFAYSVFTHFGEDLHLRYLPLLAEHMTEGALLIVTVRPSHQLVTGPNLPTTSDPELQETLLKRYANGEFVFQTYAGQDAAGSWGEAFIPRQYIQKHWSKWFDLVDYQLLLHTMAQFVVVLRKR